MFFCRYLSNKWATNPTLNPSKEHVEWLYAFDVHCNAFFPLFMQLYVLQFLLLPVLTPNTFISLLLANSLYLFAFSYYCYVPFRGFAEMQFVARTESFLLPIPLLAIIFLVLTFVLQYNCTHAILALYF